MVRFCFVIVWLGAPVASTADRYLVFHCKRWLVEDRLDVLPSRYVLGYCVETHLLYRVTYGVFVHCLLISWLFFCVAESLKHHSRLCCVKMWLSVIVLRFLSGCRSGGNRYAADSQQKGSSNLYKIVVMSKQYRMSLGVLLLHLTIHRRNSNLPYILRCDRFLKQVSYLARSASGERDRRGGSPVSTSGVEGCHCCCWAGRFWRLVLLPGCRVKNASALMIRAQRQVSNFGSHTLIDQLSVLSRILFSHLKAAV